MRTQDIEARTLVELVALDPGYVTQPEGRLAMTRAVFVALVVLRVYLAVLLILVAYRFAGYAHLVK